MSRALKFLRAGAVGPFSGFVWPRPVAGEPGQWVRAPGTPVVCRSAIHACRVRDLPRWIDEELWVVELAGVVIEEDTKLAAGAGRLLHRVDSWTHATAGEFARACAERAAQHDAGYGDDARALAEDAAAAATAYVAAHAAARARGDDGAAAERAWQAAWLADRLELAGLP